MNTLKWLSMIVGVIVAVTLVVSFLKIYFRDITRYREKDVTTRERSRRLVLLLLSTSVLIMFLICIVLLGKHDFASDDSESILLIGIGYGFAILYVVLGSKWFLEEFNSTKHTIKSSIEEMDRRHSDELMTGFLSKIEEGADQQDLKGYLKDEERRMKKERADLIRKQID